MKTITVMRAIFKDIPLPLQVSLIGMWIPIINLFTFAPLLFRALLMLMLLGLQWSLVRGPYLEMTQRLKASAEKDNTDTEGGIR